MEIFLSLGQEKAYIYEIKNKNGLKASLTNFGAILLTLEVPDNNGEFRDIVLGYKNPADYLKNDPCFGCSVLPVANRIGKATFTLNGQKYSLDKNDGSNNLHSGLNPLHKRIWTVEDAKENSLCFSITAKDMDMGFPGNREFSVTYTLTDNNELMIDYTGFSDKDTLFNPTNHSYFNLKGHDQGNIFAHKLWVNADAYTDVGQNLICNGQLKNIENTPMDFKKPKLIGQDIKADYETLKWADGYDHNYVLNKDREYVASLFSPESKIKLEVKTDMPGLQVYSGNYICKNDISKSGKPYEKYAGLALETQYFPNAINVENFESPILKANTFVAHKTIYKFSTV